MAKKNTKKITPRLSREAEIFLTDFFSSVNAGAEYCLNGLPAILSRFCYHSLRPNFSEEEIELMRNVYKDIPLSLPATATRLLSAIEECFFFSRLGDRPVVDIDNLLEKLTSLSAPDIFFIEIFLSNQNLSEDPVTFLLNK